MIKVADLRSQPIRTHLRRVKIRMTRNGYHFAFIALFTVIGAVVRDLNLLVILSGLLIGALAIQWRFCRATLAGLSVSRRLPREVYAGAGFQIRYEVHNHHNRLPAWLLTLEDQMSNELRRTESARGHSTVGVIPGNDHALAGFPCRIDQRGKYRLGPLRIQTGFPFGLMNAFQYLKIRETVTVFPRLGSLKRNWQGWLMSRQVGVAVTRRRAGVNEGDFYGLRGWQNGDSRKWIHWRTTARAGELMVRQFEQQQRQQLAVFVDLHQPNEDEKAFERLISFVATLTHEVCLNPANQIAVAMSDGMASSNMERRDREFRNHVLESLSVAVRSDSPNLGGMLGRLLSVGDSNWPILIASSRPVSIDSIDDGTVPERLLSRLDIRWLDLSDPATANVFKEVRHAEA